MYEESKGESAFFDESKVITYRSNSSTSDTDKLDDLLMSAQMRRINEDNMNIAESKEFSFQRDRERSSSVFQSLYQTVQLILPDGRKDIEVLIELLSKDFASEPRILEIL